MKCLKSLGEEVPEETEVLAVPLLELGFQLAPLPDFHVRRGCPDLDKSRIKARPPLPPGPHSKPEQKNQTQDNPYSAAHRAV